MQKIIEPILITLIAILSLLSGLFFFYLVYYGLITEIYSTEATRKMSILVVISGSTVYLSNMLMERTRINLSTTQQIRLST